MAKTAEKKSLRYVVNVKTGVPFVMTAHIKQYMHKKNMKDLRLMPVGWKPGDDYSVVEEDMELSDQMISTLSKTLAAKLGDAATEEDIRLAIGEITGTTPAPSDDEVSLSDPNSIQSVIAVVAEMDPDNADEYTNAGKPDLRIVSSRVGRRVTSAELDEALETMKAEVVE
jgi:hypothetical protein